MSRAIEIVPVGLRFEGRAVLIVGAGPIAARKAHAYASRGAVLTVVAPRHSAEMNAVEAPRRLHRQFEPSDLEGVWLVVTATGNPAVDGHVYNEAETRRIWCNAADDPEHCSVILPAVARRGDITVGISTGGTSPATASWLRRRIMALLDDPTMAVAASAARARAELRSLGHRTEVAAWECILDSEALLLTTTAEPGALEQRLIDAVVADQR